MFSILHDGWSHSHSSPLITSYPIPFPLLPKPEFFTIGNVLLESFPLEHLIFETVRAFGVARTTTRSTSPSPVTETTRQYHCLLTAARETRNNNTNHEFHLYSTCRQCIGEFYWSIGIGFIVVGWKHMGWWYNIVIQRRKRNM